MSETISDGDYLLAKQDDGNSVVYRKGIAVWDKWSYEASLSIPVLPIINTPIPSISTSIPILIKTNVNPIGMSYWRNINQHSSSGTLNLFLSINDELTLFTIDKSSLQVISEKELGIHHTGEGCWFSAIDPNSLFVPIDNTLYKYNIITGDRIVTWVDANILWQCHGSYDDQTFSATIKDSNYNVIKWGILGSELGYRLYDIKGDPDECQIDKSGKKLVIKEDNYNRIINIATEDEIIISNEAGAVGHSDCGFDCILGENDMSPNAGACDLIKFDDMSHKMIYSTGIWNMGYISFSNAKPNIRIEDQFCLMTTPTELIQVKLDGSLNGRVICNNLTDIPVNATDDQKYKYRAKANICNEGQFAVWTSFVNGQLNCYLVRL